MSNHVERELERLAADIRDDIHRSENFDRAVIGLWAPMAYAERLEKLLAEQREGDTWSHQ